MSDLDTLIDEIHKYKRNSDIDDFKSEISNSNLYFFVIDDGSFSSVTEIVWTSKERPISIPTISKEDTVFGVLYVSKEMAISMKEERFRIVHTRGLKALEMMIGINEVNVIIFQGRNAHVAMECSEIKEIINYFP